jgi:hypothetical protein
VVVVLFFAAAAPAAGAGWGTPFRLAQPQTTDLTPARIAFSPSGQAAVAFGTQDEDNPGVSAAFLAVRSPGGQLSAPRPIPGAEQVLDLAFSGPALELLTGTAASGLTCCDSVGVIPLSGSRFGPTRTLVSKLTGAALGRLAVLPQARLLAAVATDHGVWAAQSSPGGRFAATGTLSASAAKPATLAASSLANGRTTLAWTATTGNFGDGGPNRIFAASGTTLTAPHGSHVALRTGSGHQIDELGLAPAPAGATAGWIESWLDRGGAYHAQVMLSDLGARARPAAFPVSGRLASGLTVVGDPSGDQLVAWKACDPTPACTVHALLRRAGQPFGVPQRLGTIDAYEDPAAAISPTGTALVGWIDGGHVRAAARRLADGAFPAPRLVSSTTYAADLVLAFGSQGQALAAWTQGTFAPDLVGAMYR